MSKAANQLSRKSSDVPVLAATPRAASVAPSSTGSGWIPASPGPPADAAPRRADMIESPQEINEAAAHSDKGVTLKPILRMPA